MLVLKIIVSLVFWLAVIFLLTYSCTILPVKLNAYFQKKYNYKPFTTFTITLSLLAAPLLVLGWKWYGYSLGSGGDTGNGIVLMAFGVLSAVFLLYKNIKNSNLLFGAGITTLLLLIFGILAFLIGGLIFIWIIIPFIKAFFPRTVYIRY